MTHGDAHVVVHKEIPPPSLLPSRPTGYACDSGATTLSRCLQLRLSESSLILRSEIKLNPVISLNFSTARGREHSRDGDTGSNEGRGGRRKNCLSLGNKHKSAIFQGKRNITSKSLLFRKHERQHWCGVCYALQDGTLLHTRLCV